MLTILFDGVAYGMLLFVLACGLSVTLGLMNFVNLAHGSFAMAGGYITLVLVNQVGVPFFAGLAIAFVVTALIGALFERSLYAHVYGKSDLEQVLFTIGLVFRSVASVDRVMGSQQVFIDIPRALQGRFEIFGVGVGRYRLLIIVICGVLTLGLQLILSGTRFGARLRASVDDARVARGLGINVSAVFTLTFAFGSGLAGLGGALGAEILGLDPTFPLKFMVYFLIVVTVGGTSSITGPFVASLLIGIADVAGKYYVPKFGAFIIYTIMIVMLILRPRGLFARAAGQERGARRPVDPARRPGRPPPRVARALGRARIRLLARRARERLPVVEPLPDPHRDRLARSVRALARPHPRLRRHYFTWPRCVLRTRLLQRRAARQTRHHPRARAGALCLRPRRGGARLRDQLPRAARLRPDSPDGDAGGGVDHARDRQPDPAGHRRRGRPAGSRHRTDPGHVRVRHLRQGRLHLLPDRAVRAVPAGAARGLFAVRPFAAGGEGEPAAFGLDRHLGQCAARRGLHLRRLLCGGRRRASGADHGFRFAR